MNKTRYEAIEASQSAIARKVLSVVPIQERWNAKQIYAELQRQTHASVDRRVVDGCLRMLVDSCLVREHPRGAYIREMPKEDQPKLKLVKESEPTSTEPETMTIPEPAPAPAPTKPNPLDRLATATKKLRDALSEIEDAALEASQAIEAANAQTAQLHQLKQLLKGIVE